MLSTQGTSQRSHRPSIHINSFTPLSDFYTDARLHGYQGPRRTVRLPGAASSGGGTIAKSEDGERCVVAGKECNNDPPSFRTPFIMITLTRSFAHLARFRLAKFA